jgi:hypothetical protein
MAYSNLGLAFHGSVGSSQPRAQLHRGFSAQVRCDGRAEVISPKTRGEAKYLRGSRVDNYQSSMKDRHVEIRDLKSLWRGNSL